MLRAWQHSLARAPTAAEQASEVMRQARGNLHSRHGALRAGCRSRLLGYTLLMLISCVGSAVIEVTAGGDVHEPTYQFSDVTGPVANLTSGSSGTIKASGDLESGSGVSLEAMARLLDAALVRIQAAEYTIAQLNATVISLQGQVAGKMDARTVDTSVVHGSTNLITSGAVRAETSTTYANVYSDVQYYCLTPNGITCNVG